MTSGEHQTPKVGDIWVDDCDDSKWTIVAIDEAWVWVKRVLYGAAAKSSRQGSIATHPSYFDGNHWQRAA